MLTLTQRLAADPSAPVYLTLALTAEERMRSRHYFEAEGQPLYLHLPRGTVLRHGDLLKPDSGDRLVRIAAKPEPVYSVTAPTPFDLLRAAYHLGNRHVALEVQPERLRLSPDSVLKQMLEQMGLAVQEEIAPFQPESGAYGHSHSAQIHAHTP